MNSNKILAIDFGLKNIGLAMNQNDILLTLPDYKYISKDKFTKDIKLIIKDFNINEVVFGIPPYNKSLENSIREHGNKLKGRCIKINYINENLTSKIFEQDDYVGSDHSMAAREILSEYINNRIID